MEYFIPWELIKKYLRNDLSERESKELNLWIESSDFNHLAFKEISEDEQFKNILIQEKWENHKYNWERFKNKIKLPDKRFVIKRKSAIAILSSFSILLLIILGFLYRYSLDLKQIKRTDAYTYIFSPKGQRTQVILPDSSKVWLNSGSSIRYPASFNLKNREVYLEGEAFFDIKKSKKIFIVKTIDAFIKVYGTKFNVKAYPEDNYVETTLIHGKISLIPLNYKGKKHEIVLKPREKCIIERKEKLLEKRVTVDSLKFKASSEKLLNEKKEIEVPIVKVQRNVDAEKEESWKDGRLVFKREKFEDLAIKLERWYDVKIHFLDEKIKNYVFTGVFDRETVDQAMEALRLSSGKTYSYKMKYRDIYLYIDK